MSGNRPARSIFSAGIVSFVLLVLQHAAAAPVTVADWVTTADGLPNPYVEAIVRDRAGYVWIGTRGGLVRHEGVRLNVLRRDPDRPGSLPGDNILALMAADDGDVWAAVSEQGIVRIRGVEVVEHWANERDEGPLRGSYVWSLEQACDGSVWAVYATDGLVRIDPESGTAKHFEPGELGLADSGFGLELVADERCRMWLVRTDGLWRVETSPPFGFERVIVPDESASQVFLSMLLTGGNDAFITGRSGVSRVDLGDNEDGARIVESWVLDTSVNLARPAADGRLWLGMRRGLDLFDPVTGETSSVRFASELESLEGVQVVDIMPGAEGEVWVGSVGRGVARLPPGWRGFSPIRPRLSDAEIERVTSIAFDPDGTAWLGSSNHGVQRLDMQTGQARAPEIDFVQQGYEVIGLHLTENLAWSLGRRLLVRGDRNTAQARVLIEHDPGSEEHFRFLAPGENGEIWVAGGNAYLLRIAASGEVLDRWDSESGPKRRLKDSALRTIQRGPAGHWWLLGTDVLYRQGENGVFVEVHSPESTNLVAMAFQGDRLWLAADSALEAFVVGADGSLERVQRYTAGDGLPAGRVQGMMPRPNHLWLLMSIGLARLDTEGGRFRLFSAPEGLVQSEFNPGAAVELEDGRFAAGTNNGLLVVDPAAIRPTTSPPPVHLISVRAGDRRYALDGTTDSPLNFDWKQNSLEFSFLALSYINPAENRYRIRLTGWEDEWQELKGQTTRFFSNLPSGRYRFEVQAANVDGLWNREGDRVAFTIAPPPWRSATAWIAYALIALVATGSGWRAMIGRRRRRESLRQAHEQQQLADRQRELLERLNRSLEPERLAETIGESVRDLAGVSACHVGYLQADFPGRVWSFGAGEDPPGRARFDAAMADAGPGEVLVLGKADAPLAAVWLPDLDDDRRAALRGRLDLFAQTAGQVLENARLLLSVRKLAHKANEASEAKSEFLATMSHEIRTPLHGLLGMMDLLEQTETDPAQLDMLRTMRGSGRQLQRILNDVLDLSRIEAGRVELQARAFELVPMLERVIDLHAPNAASAGLELRLVIAADLPVMAIGDADRIAQIVGNLVSNAIKFTTSGWVELEARLDADDRLVLSICDTGPGIDASVRAELFEPFTQLESTSTRKHSGTGLGLAICRRLVDAMHGRLELTSEPGRGSCFSVHLPLAGMHPQPPFETALTRGLRLGVALRAPELEQFKHLATRWSIEWVECDRSGRPDPNGFDALLWQEGALEASVAQAWRDTGVACWHLGHEPLSARDDMPRLRAPLIESRLIGALMDFRLSRIAAG